MIWKNETKDGTKILFITKQIGHRDIKYLGILEDNETGRKFFEEWTENGRSFRCFGDCCSLVKIEELEK